MSFHSIGCVAEHKNFLPTKSLFVLLVLLLSFTAWGHTDTEQIGQGEDILQGLGHPGKLQVAPVVVNGRVLFQLIGIPAYPAKKRVKKTVRAIEKLALDPDFDPDSLKIVEHEIRHSIFAGDSQKPVVRIFDQDAELEGVERSLFIVPVRKKIAKAIKAYRHERKPEVMRKNVIQAVLHTIGLVLAVFAVLWIFRRLHVLLETKVKTKIQKLEVKSVRVIQADHVWALVNAGLRLARFLTILLLGYLFLNFVLRLFPLTRNVSRILLSYVIDPLTTMTMAILNYIPSLFFLVLLFFIFRFLLKILNRFFVAVARGRIQLGGFDPDWSIPTYRIVRVVVILFAVVLAYPYIPGSQSEAFKGISILFGVLFSLGSTSVISNVIAGYTMTYRRAFRVGDRVKIGEITGDVLESRVLVTHVRSLKNEEVIIPNSTILNNEVINYSNMTEEYGLILHTTVGIGYEVPWRQVETMLLTAAERTTGILKAPSPFVLQTALGDFAVDYQINAYCDDEKQSLAIYTELHRNILDIFNEYGVEIMTPHYETDTRDPKIVPKEKWYSQPATPPEPTSPK